MSRQRYFHNRFPDYNPSAPFEKPKEEWHTQITDVIQKVVEATSSSQLSHDGGLYVGSAGIAYMLYYASTYQPLHQYRDTWLKSASDIIAKDLIYAKKTKSAADKVSFILGPAGVYATAAMIGLAIYDCAMVEKNVRKYQSVSSQCLVKDFLAHGCDELFVGRAGYLCGVLALEKNLKMKVLSDDDINAICHLMVESGRRYSQRHNSSAPLMYAYHGTEYLGAAHGISSILQILLSCPGFCASSQSDATLVKSSVDWILSLQQPNGNFVPSLDELTDPRPEIEELLHWCHGAPGIVYLLARAYQVWKEPAYLEACLKCGEITWHKGLLRKGPGICHGIAGSGYVFLLLYRLTGDKKHLYRAHKFAEFLFAEEFLQGARTPDNPMSLYEGWAGTVCFLIDLLQPDKAELPFFTVV